MTCGLKPEVTDHRSEGRESLGAYLWTLRKAPHPEKRNSFPSFTPAYKNVKGGKKPSPIQKKKSGFVTIIMKAKTIWRSKLPPLSSYELSDLTSSTSSSLLGFGNIAGG